MTAPAPQPVDTGLTPEQQAAVTAIAVAILAGGTLAEIKQLLASGLPDVTPAVLKQVVEARGFDDFIEQAISAAADVLPEPVDLPSAPPVAAVEPTTPAPATPAKPKPSAPSEPAKQPGKPTATPVKSAVPQSIQDQVNAALAKKGKVRPTPAKAPAPSTAIRLQLPDQEAQSRAAYLVKASERMAAAYSTGDDDTIAAANAAEDRYQAQHEAAVKSRARAVSMVARATAKRKPDENGEVLLGWYAHISDNTCARCLRADGRNFDALVPPPIGYPGAVHPHDHCLPGPPYADAERVEQVDPSLRVSRLQFGKGSKLWKYWTKGKGFAKFASSPTPWTTLKALLIEHGVPANEAGGLATNIMLATPAGMALFKAHHQGKRSDAMTIETRAAVVAEIRGPGTDQPDAKPGFTARAVQYGVADTYNTSWQRGTFTDTLEQRMPSVVWCHDWSDPIGRVVGYRDTDSGLDIDVELDDLEAVPRAKQAYAQLRSGSMNQFSFAFKRGEEMADPNLRGVTRITKADLDEFSVVLNGSVPGTHVTAIRSAAGTVSADAARDLVTRFAAGGIDLEHALTELRAATAGQPAETRAAKFEFRALGDPAGADPTATLAAVSDALTSLAGSLDIEDVEAARQWFNQGASLLSELQYLLGQVPGLTPNYAWRDAKPAEVRTMVVIEPTTDADKAEQEADDVLAALDRVTQRSALRTARR